MPETGVSFQNFHEEGSSAADQEKVAEGCIGVGRKGGNQEEIGWKAGSIIRFMCLLELIL